MQLSLAGMPRHAVLLADTGYPELLARVDRFFDVELVDGVVLLDAQRLRANLAGKSALIAMQTAPIDATLLATLPHLKVVCRIGPSHAGIDLAACTRAGVIATNTADFGPDEAGRRQMARDAADNLIAAFGFGRAGGHPKNLLNTDLRCTLGCCL